MREKKTNQTNLGTNHEFYTYLDRQTYKLLWMVNKTILYKIHIQ